MHIACNFHFGILQREYLPEKVRRFFQYLLTYINYWVIIILHSQVPALKRYYRLREIKQ
jgi:hypothetical protein